ncbi:hypothetical protein BDD12DRAFT_802382 [Trichophaea hybrida]|nr:hypothetical protein BDD12DRAFT_802382 [Trichophaea hybrida]
MSTQPRSTSKPLKPKIKSENFLDQIKRLEAHVQEMERNYVEQLRKRAAEKDILKGDVTEEMKDQAYHALMAPPPGALFLPHVKQVAERLSVAVRERLGTNLALVNTAEPQWNAVLTLLEQNGGFEGMGKGDIVGLLICMDVPQRAELSTKVLEMMESVGLEPNVWIYDLILASQAAVGNTTYVKTLFNTLVEKGLKPTVYSYGHLLKAYSKESDVAAAAAAFQQMQASGIEPNLIVYTTLIQTCINRNEFETAWQIFNLIKLKSTATAPDVATYSLMIHACAMNGESERAVDLFTDMTVRRGMVPNSETYQALIHACAVRKDYFAQAWKYASEMQSLGMKLDKRAFNVLIQACGRVGELTRARLLVRHLNDSGNPDLLPDKLTFQNLLRSYATYVVKATWKDITRKSKRGADQQKETIEADEAAFVAPKQELSRDRGNRILVSKIPFLPKSILQNPREVLDEAAMIVQWLREEKPEFVDTQLMNSYLDVCASQYCFQDLIWSYNHDFENPPNPFTQRQKQQQPKKETLTQEEMDEALLAEDDLPKFQRNIFTYRNALNAAVKFRNLPFARQVWKDRLDFTLTPAYRRETPFQREKADFEAERLMIWVLALGNKLDEAMERVQILAKDGGVEWKWEDLQTVYIKAVQLENAQVAASIGAITGRMPSDEDEDKLFRSRRRR